ncbi:MAG: hypothetical protein HPY50_07190 [Firmicutes bacterium]|nr:hypothetical protein [Bacillota bacterium]
MEDGIINFIKSILPNKFLRKYFIYIKNNYIAVILCLVSTLFLGRFVYSKYGLLGIDNINVQIFIFLIITTSFLWGYILNAIINLHKKPSKIVLGVKWYYKRTANGDIQLDENPHCLKCDEPLQINIYETKCSSCGWNEYMEKYVGGNFESWQALLEFVEGKIKDQRIQPRLEPEYHHDSGGFYS